MRRCCCVLPCSVSRTWLIAALLAFLIGWGVFFGALIYAQRKASGMIGYEWIPGFCIAPLSLVCLLGIRHGKGWGDLERRSSENEICMRMVLLFILVGGAYIAAFLTIPFQWMGLMVAGNPQLLMSSSLHSAAPSPTPQPSVHKTSEHNPADNTVGILLFVHMLTLTLAVFFAWQYGENWRLEEQLLHEDSTLELSSM